MTDVMQIDRDAAAEWAFMECKYCSQYEGDFEADLAADFARHRSLNDEGVRGLVEAAKAGHAALTAPTIGTTDMDDPDWYHAVADAVAKLSAALAKFERLL